MHASAGHDRLPAPPKIMFGIRPSLTAARGHATRALGGGTAGMSVVPSYRRRPSARGMRRRPAALKAPNHLDISWPTTFYFFWSTQGREVNRPKNG